MPAWQEYLEQNQRRFLGELFELLRFPTIGTLPQHAPDLRRAAEWLRVRLEHIEDRASGSPDASGGNESRR